MTSKGFRRLLLCLTPLLLLAAACSLPTAEEMNGKKPLMITNEPAGSELQRTGCLTGIVSTIGGAITTYKLWKEGTERDTGLALMQTNDGTYFYINVRVPENWRKIAGFAGLTAADGAVTIDTCRYTLFAGKSITYWCGAGERQFYRWDSWDAAASPMQMRPEDYDFFFNSGSYACWNGWAYTRPPDPPGYCWALPCIWERGQP